MDLITHFSHRRHKLALEKSCKMYLKVCEICKEHLYSKDIDELVYTCNSKKCEFSIHKLCAEIFPEKKTNHPFHPHHTLLFRNITNDDDDDDVQQQKRCSLCKRSTRYKYGYYCQEEDCNFVLDPKCAALTPKSINTFHHQHHDHDVLECVKPDIFHFRYICQVCGESFEHYYDDNVFVCIEGDVHLLHEICVSLPDQILHPFHFQHPLILQLLHNQHICQACCIPTRIFYTDITCLYKVYHCSSCKFTLDIHCALQLKPIIINNNIHDHDQEDVKKIITPSHPHPLIQCGMDKNFFRRSCFGCGIWIEGFIYVCLDCKILLNKLCVDLPSYIFHHPFHPQHPRLLLGKRFLSCNGCRKNTGRYLYSCEDCNDFALDVKCATGSFEFVKFEHEVHYQNHVFAYFGGDFEANGGKCKTCKSDCTKYFFKCIDCYDTVFSIHDHCCPSSLLPPTINHPCHFHSLTLTLSIIKDDEEEDELWGEFYCNACEERRELYNAMYYCAECHFIAHVHCVISEIMTYFKEKQVMTDKARAEELEWEHEQVETSYKGKIEDQVDFDKQKVEEQTKDGEEKEDDTYFNNRYRSTDRSDLKKDEKNYKVKNKKHMLQEIDEKIQDIKKIINSWKQELAKLLERRTQLIEEN